MAELISRPLVEIAQELRERRLTSQEVVEAAIARHERFGERLQAYCLWTPEKARETAKAADTAFASGATVGPLQGIPISIKDLYAAEGLPCFAGSGRRLRLNAGRLLDRVVGLDRGGSRRVDDDDPMHPADGRTVDGRNRGAGAGSWDQERRANAKQRRNGVQRAYPHDAL